MKINNAVFSILAVLLISTQVNAQKPSEDKVSVGLSYGASQILGAEIPIGKDAFSPRHIQVDARYFFRPLIGVAGQYGYSGFNQNSEIDAFGFHRIALEGILSLGEVFKFESDFDLFTHAGGGLSLSSREKDKMITFMVGLTPEYRISNQLAVKGDVSYINNRKQYNDYTGTTLAPNLRGAGNLMNYSIGFQFYFAATKHGSIRY